MEEERSWQPGISAQKGTSAHQAQRRYQSVCLRGKTQNQLRSNENEIAFAKKIRPLRINNVNLQIVQKERFSEAAAKETRASPSKWTQNMLGKTIRGNTKELSLISTQGDNTPWWRKAWKP